jgi:release factor glutamine methyltransferase
MPEVSRHDPALALYAGLDGLESIRILMGTCGRLVAPGGFGLLEFGDGQCDAVRGLAAEAGIEAEILDDLSGRPRALLFGKALGKGSGTV